MARECHHSSAELEKRYEYCLLSSHLSNTGVALQSSPDRGIPLAPRDAVVQRMLRVGLVSGTTGTQHTTYDDDKIQCTNTVVTLNANAR